MKKIILPPLMTFGSSSEKFLIIFSGHCFKKFLGDFF